MKASDQAIGKAEHLKVLLLEWMKRNDTPRQFYTNSKYNEWKGARSLLSEINSRRTWRRMDLWKSDSTLSFGPLAYTEKKVYTRSEYLYLGRTTPGKVKIRSISVRGLHAKYFHLDTRSGSIKENDHLTVKVTFISKTKFSLKKVKAQVEVLSDKGTDRIDISG